MQRRETFFRKLGISPHKPTNAKNDTNVLETTNSQSEDRGLQSQSGPVMPSNPDLRPSSNPKTLKNLSLAEAAFAMELDDEVTNKGEERYCVPKFGPKKGDSSQGR
jgi:hypothetical protein